MIQVKTFFAFNELRNFSYLIYDDQTGDAWSIDPYEAQPIINYIKKESLVLKGILNTHKHHDHLRGNPALQRAFSCEICDLTRTKAISLNSKQDLEIIDTPGHTMDHKAFIWKTKANPVALFSGDTLFNGGVGNCKGGGDPATLYQTTLNLSRLPDEVVLYPGHDYLKKNLSFASQLEPENIHIKETLRRLDDAETEKGLSWTLGQEKLVNPFLRLNSEEIKQNVKGETKSLEELNEKSLFLKLRSLRDKW